MTTDKKVNRQRNGAGQNTVSVAVLSHVLCNNLVKFYNRFVFPSLCQCKSWFPQGEIKTFLCLCPSLLDLTTPSFIIYSYSPVSWQFTTWQFNIENQSWRGKKLMTELLSNAKLCSCISSTSNYQLDPYGESCASHARVKADWIE